MSKNNELGTFSTFMGKKSGAQQLETYTCFLHDQHRKYFVNFLNMQLFKKRAK